MSKSNTMKKLDSILASKEEIKEEIVAKGGSIDDSTPFAEHGDAIQELSGGVDTTLIDMIEGNEFDLIIPRKATKIARSAFRNNQYITTLYIPNTITAIDQDSFASIPTLRSVEIEKGLEFLGKNMFASCTNLSSINIPNTVTKLDYGVFNGCSSLTYLVVPSSVSTYGSYCLNIGSPTNQATIRFEHTVPPAVPNSAMTLANIKEIQVPAGSAEAYKSKTTFANYAELIVEF